MDVLKLLHDQSAQNRANFAEAQAARAEAAATKQPQWTAQGRDADSGQMAIAANGDAPKLLGDRITSGNMKRGQAVRVNAAGGLVTVDQKPASRSQKTIIQSRSTTQNIKILSGITTQAGFELWVGGWQSESMQVTVFKSSVGLGLNATLSNLGGDDWQVDLAYAANNKFYVEVIASDSSRNYKRETPVLCNSKGYGFFIGSYDQTGSTDTRYTGYDVPFQIITTSVYGSSKQFYLFNEIERETRIDSYTVVRTAHIVNFGAMDNGGGQNTADTPIRYGYEQILSPGDSDFEQPLQVQNYVNINRHEAGRPGLYGNNLDGVGDILTGQELELKPLRINADGSAGVCRNTAYYSYDLGGIDFAWIDAAGTNTFTDPELYFDLSILLDVFESNFTMLIADDFDTFSSAYRWTENEALHLDSYSSEFTLLERLEVSVYPLALPDGTQPQIFAGSYHP